MLVTAKAPAIISGDARLSAKGSVMAGSMNGKGLIKLAIIMILALLLAACGKEELHSDLPENQANDMTSVLLNSGIDAEKKPAEQGKFAVYVNQSDFARAVEILRANGLPREEYASLCTVFQKGTYNSSKEEEHARFICALQQELTNTISQIDGVVEARVHLNIPMKDTLVQDTQPPSASVLVKYRPGFDLSSKTGQIKTLVQNGVAGLSPDNISVMMERSRAIPMPKKSFVQDGLVTLLMTIAGLVAAVAIGIAGYRWWRSRPVKTSVPVVQVNED